MSTRRYVRILLAIVLVLVPAVVGVLAAANVESRAASLPGPQAAHGSDSTLLIKPNGSLWAWGRNDYGQLGDGTTTGSPVAIRVGAATDWRAVACGDQFSLGIRSDGSLWAWGENTYGSLGLGDIAHRSTPQRVGSSTAWVAVAGGNDHALALRGDGTLWAWGHNASGQLGLGDTADVLAPAQVGSATDWDAVSCGADFSAALKDDGTLWTWGHNSRSQLGLGDTDGRLEPTQVGGDPDWTSVQCGDEDARALKSGGTLWAWGYNSFGQLGLGDKKIRTTPTQVGSDTDWAEIACGDDHTVARKSGGSLWACGDNTYGQLGQGDTTALDTLTRVGAAADWSRVLCGDDFTTALRPGGELWGCGDNTSGDLSLGDLANRLSPTLLFITSDTTGPVIGSLTSSTHPDSSVWYALSGLSYAWSASDASGVAGYRSELDQAAGTVVGTGLPSPATTRDYAGSADGLHYFHVRAVDRAGNWGVTSTRVTRVDTTPPSTSSVTPVDGATYTEGSTVTCGWTCSDTNSGVVTETARLDGSPIAEGAAIDTTGIGAHTFAISATDLAGNEGLTTVAYSVAAAPTFTITASAGLNGSISPSGEQIVDSGADQTFTITPDPGYQVADVLVDDVSQGPLPSYTFASVDADHVISATFAIDTFTIT
ncbi:MAG TPA: hypothetical protein VFH61_02500, partial [Thermoleophilia bacterium]|nr:hypothetical protein [Thermoleophilia bacterium]